MPALVVNIALLDEVRSSLEALEEVTFLESPSWDALRAGASSVSAADLAARQAATRRADPLNIRYTSATTGFPKGRTREGCRASAGGLLSSRDP